MSNTKPRLPSVEVGTKFGRLTVEKAYVYNQKTWCHVICECGTRKNVQAGHIKRGATKSCGCLNRELIASRNFAGRTHGMFGTPEYESWSSMIQRCENINHKSYSDYGARGIKVDIRWRNNFEAFLSDMGPRPGLGYSIDRIDNDKGYTKDNCRWATTKEQARNRRSSRVVSAFGASRTVSEWSEIYKMRKNTLAWRLDHGFSPEDALTKPVRRLRRKTAPGKGLL